ncbi:hypothetical protein evm_015204 [Chilo suppressalis]|nr:hypothetical protein evm_015204 [Chilo suppressalis]
MQSTVEELNDIQEFEIDVEANVSTSSPFRLEGRRIVDFSHFFDQIKSSDHNPGLGCSISNMQIVREKIIGLESVIYFQCNMCNQKFQVNSCTTSLAMDLPNINQKTYNKCHSDVSNWWAVAAETSMKEAAREETSGAAAIIGFKTGKVLFMRVKNKYCVVCARSASKNQSPPIHQCTKNYVGSSTSMEQTSIVEGFKTSVTTQLNLIYKTLIADGDASTYKKILESRPYPNVQVQKIEYSNHLLRNYNSKLMHLQKDTSIPLSERKLLTNERITRLRTAVRAAARFRNAQNTNSSDKIIKLKDDIINSPKHIFGDHSTCEEYYCKEEKKKEQNLVPLLKTLFRKVMVYTIQIALNSKSLLYDRNDYGERCQKPDLTPEQYETAKNIFLQNLKGLVEKRHEVERDTVLQAESALWLELRRCLLTASSFSKVCKRRCNISSAPLVKSLVYSYSLDSVTAIEYGKTNEKTAIKQLEQQEGIVVQKCGLFIDQKYFFLGASPDGLFEEGIVEMKCPYSARNMDVEQAIIQKKIKFWKIDGLLNTNHDWYFQIQGQLHISQKNVCLFAVWTGQEFAIKTTKITRDDVFWTTKMEPKLVEFYNKCLLPELIDPRKSRSMPIRDVQL